MNLNLLFSLSAVIALSVSARGSVLLDERFDNPTDITYSYPTETGGSPGMHGKFSGWSNGGVISVNYGAGMGVGGSGGMLCTVVKPSAEFMQVSYERVALPFSDPTYLTRKVLAAYQLEFHACIPKGRTLTLYLAPQGPKEMETQFWNSRLILGKVVGTGTYDHYVLPASVASDRNFTLFIRSVSDAFLNGAEKAEVTVVWNFATTEETWIVGEYFQIDNLKLSTGL